MKLLASSKFNQQMDSLDPATRHRIWYPIAQLRDETPESVMSQPNRIQMLDATEGVYVYRAAPDVRVFFTLGEEEGSPYLLLLDLIHTAFDAVPLVRGQRDPRKNPQLNPLLNSAINPKFNSAINPKFNSAINPKFNSAINPKFNSAINPKFNSSINPKFNSAINPKFNSAINPKFNSALNPRINTTFSGPVRYDLELRSTGYYVRANEQVTLYFDASGDYQGVVVTASASAHPVFDTSLEWQGYLIPVQGGISLEFTVDGEWNAFSV